MESLGIDYKLLIAQVINFGVLFFLFSRYMAKPFMTYLSEEKKKDMERDRIHQELTSKEEKMKEEEAVFRRHLKQEQDKVLTKTKVEAETMKTEILAEARSEAEELIERGRRQVEEERVKFHQEVKRHISDVSILVIENALKKHLTEDVQKKLTQHVLASYKKDN